MKLSSPSCIHVNFKNYKPTSILLNPGENCNARKERKVRKKEENRKRKKRRKTNEKKECKKNERKEERKNRKEKTNSNGKEKKKKERIRIKG